MKKLLIGLAVVVVVVVAAAFIVPGLIPLDTYKTQLSEQVKAATGRDLAIDGDVQLTILPNLAVTAEGVRFSNAPDGSAPEMATLESLRATVQLLPLIGGDIAIDEFVLVKPEILLEVDEQGRPNWQFGDAAAQAADDTAASDQGAGDQSGGSGAASALSGLSLGDVRIVEGKVTYIDRATGTQEEITDLNVELSLPDINSPFNAAGNFILRGQKIGMELDLASLAQLMGGTATPVKAAVSSDLVSLTFDGEATQAEAPVVTGNIDLDVPSVRQLIVFATPDQPFEAAEGTFGPFKVNGKLDMVGQKVSFQDAEITFDALVARGNMQVDSSAAVPRITASVSTEFLDVTPYLGAADEGAAGTEQDASGDSGSGTAESEGWSDDPIDLSGLKAADADISISTAGLKVNEIEIGQSALAILLEGGRLTANLTEMQLYNGNGSGQVVADGSGATPTVAAKFDLSGVAAEPLLIDAAQMDRLSGTLDGNLDVTSSGGSQKALVSALNGTTAFKFTNGALKGVNIASMFRNISLDAIKGSFAEAEKTDFAELSGTFQITDGIARNSDLLMQAPILRMTGEGEIAMPSRTINYLIKPRLVGTLEGQGGDAAPPGLTIPVRIQGSWDDPSYQPDMEAVLKGIADPSKLLEGIEGAATGGAGAVKDAVEGVTGAGEGAVEGVGDKIKNLFD